MQLCVKYCSLKHEDKCRAQATQDMEDAQQPKNIQFNWAANHTGTCLQQNHCFPVVQCTGRVPKNLCHIKDAQYGQNCVILTAKLAAKKRSPVCRGLRHHPLIAHYLTPSGDDTSYITAIHLISINTPRILNISGLRIRANSVERHFIWWFELLSYEITERPRGIQSSHLAVTSNLLPNKIHNHMLNKCFCTLNSSWMRTEVQLLLLKRPS